MTGWDTALTIANIIITGISCVGAYKSRRYYRKSRNITILTQVKQALNEISEMLQRLPDVLLTTNNKRKGFNPTNAVREIGKELSDHLNKAMDVVSADYSNEFRELQKNYSFDLPKYINSMMDGTVLKQDNDRLILDRLGFDQCQEQLRMMQQFLKKKVSEAEEKLK